MSGSIYGKNFQISTWGESHGKALGVTIDGCPAGIKLSEEDIQRELDLRKPGSNIYATKRNESDTVNILSGTFNGITTGTPISLIVYNNDHKSVDYSSISESFRPGHADYTFYNKYGIRDYRGGGRSSGRETISRVAAGAVAKKILFELDINILAYTYSIGGLSVDKTKLDLSEIYNNPLRMPDKAIAKEASGLLNNCIENHDSMGGVIECKISGLPIGIGETVFDKLDAQLAKGIMSIGAVKGIEFGLGFESSKILGSQNNDAFDKDKNGNIIKTTNNSGGILGGMSDSSDILLKVAFKPTPSILKTQNTVNQGGEKVNINIKGRHDPIIVPRAVVVVEAMVAVTLVDSLFSNMFSKINSIKNFYSLN